MSNPLRALAAEPTRAAQVLESVLGNAWATDEAGRFTYLSSSLLHPNRDALADSSREEHDDTFGWRKWIHPEDRERVAAAWHQCLRSGDGYEMDHRMLRASGAYAWTRCSGRPALDGEGRVLGWYGALVDIAAPSEPKTERVLSGETVVGAIAKLQERERELAQLIDMVPSHIWRLAPDGEPTFFNRPMVEFLGVDVADVGKPGMTKLAALLETVIHPDDARRFGEALESALHTGAPLVIRYRLRRTDGVYRWMSTRAVPLRDDAGDIMHWYGLCHDIDDLVRAQESLCQREQELSQLVNMVPSYLWRLGPDGEPNFFNQRMMDYLGLDAGDQDPVKLAATIGRFVHPEDVVGVQETLQRSLATGQRFGMKYRLRRADGVYRWMEARAEPMRDQAGRIVHWYGLVEDVDDDLRAQQALRNSERVLRQLVETLPAMIDCASADGEPIYRSRGLSEYLGYQLEELDGVGKSRLASTLDASVHPEDLAGVKEQYARSLATGEPYARKHRLRRFDGAYRWVETRAAAMRNEDGSISQWSVICLDIDDEVRAQQAVRDREREMSQLVAMLPSYVWRLTPEGEPNFFNKRLTDLLSAQGVGTSGPASVAEIIRGAIHPDDAEALAVEIRRSLATGEPFFMRYRMRHPDGAYRWMSGHAEPMRDVDGRIVQWYGVSHDIDDQLRAEEVLRQSERHLQQLIDALPTLIWATTPEGEPSYLNKRLVQQVGLTLDDLDRPDRSRLQSAIRDSVHPDDAPTVQQGLVRAFTSGEPFAMRYRHRRADGVYRWIDTRAEPQRAPDGHIVQWYGVMFDIEDQVRAQEELRHTRERLAIASQAASLAELSASIAHEVNQPLAAVIANSHACQRWLSGDAPNIQRAMTTVERIIRDANGAAEVVRRIRALFKESAEARGACQLQQVIAEAADLMLADAARTRITIQLELATDVPEVVIDRVQVQQVLVNLLRNGIEAIADTDALRTLTVRAFTTTEVVRVEVGDTGSGLAHPDRIFEPFFTTKETGMGMGLSICRSIVESHGGKLWAEANAVRGTTFVFTLPIAST